MLVELVIADLVLLERAVLTFGPGLNVITGETGAGKSLLIDALELLLGERPRPGLVRRGAQRATVEGRFAVERSEYGERVRAWLREHLPSALEDGAEQDGELELILGRTIGRDGRTRAHVDHHPVTQRRLRELARMLVEIHGQNDHQKLFDPAEQLFLLDAFAGLEDAAAGYRERRARWTGLARRAVQSGADELERLARIDFLRFQARELEEARLDPAEREELARERSVLRHAGELQELLARLCEALFEGDGAALDRLRLAERELDAFCERVPALAAAAAEVRESAAYLEQAAAALRTFQDGLELDPRRLEEVEARLEEYERLERKYRTDAHGIGERARAVLSELAELLAQVEGREALEAELAAAFEAAAQAGRRLAQSRRRARARLARAVHEALADLGLEGARFDLEWKAAGGGEAGTELGAHGIERVEFLLAANPGEARRPLREVASGGEVARTMLALRGALAVRRTTPTLIFDEVDSGVGGRLGPRVGAHLRELAGHHQVLCVTHLPAIAACAHRHLRVHKEVERGRTRTRVTELAREARVQEIADMIAGGADTPTAQAEARRLLESVSGGDR